MDITERKITKIAREAEKLVLLSLREEGVGTAEIDLIHALRHNPGCTQARLAELLHTDKAAIARRTKNLEAKGFLVRRDDTGDRRSQLLYPTEKAETMKSSKAEIEAAFYEYLTSTLTTEEEAAFGERMFLLERAILTRQGCDRNDDLLFDEVYQEYSAENLENSFYQTETGLTKEHYEKMLDAWYEVMGFDVATGMPKVSTFEAAGVPEIADRLVSEYGVQLPA